jgi:succinate dehydrogenase/fumarate reductase cytochrome b subunit
MARAGYVASGVLHVLVGWLAIQLALGQGGQADESGAFRALAQAPGGEVLLWAVAVAFAALALWQLAAAVVGVPGADVDRQAGARVKSAAKGVLYGVLAATALRYAEGGEGGESGEGGGGPESVTANLLSMPAGRWLVALGGLVIVGVGVFHVVKGVRKKFLEDLRGTGGGTVGTAVDRLGRIGYVAKGAALAVIGALVVTAGWTSDASQAGGMDLALRTIQEQGFGTALLVVVGLGIAAFGAYSFARARYARL